jgi:GntR family transcriptional regulator
MEWSASKPPTARDIAGYYRREIAEGNIAPLQRLPAARGLAKKLGVATMTVQSAYAQLREEGLVDSRQGSGTYAREAAADEPTAQQTAMGLRELQARLEHVTSQLTELSERVANLEGEDSRPAGRGQ